MLTETAGLFGAVPQISDTPWRGPDLYCIIQLSCGGVDTYARCEKPVTLETFDHWEILKRLFFSDDLWLIISVALLILLQAFKMKVSIYYIKLHVHEVKAHGINGKKALSGNWEELHNETCKQCIFTCVQNNFKVYFCTQIWTNKIALLPEDICLVKNNPLTFLHNFYSLVPNQI